MKKTIQTKRNAKTGAGAGFRKLHAKTSARKRRLRAATAVADPRADLESDVPNVGIGRALIVILALHVAAIAAIYLHSMFFGTEPETAKVDTPSIGRTAAVTPVIVAGTAVQPGSSVLVAPPAETMVDQGATRHLAAMGEDYSSIAHLRRVDETALRALNHNRAVRAGVVLDLPDPLSSRPIDVTPAPARPSSLVAADPVDVAPPAYSRAIVVAEESTPVAVPIVTTNVGAVVGVETVLADSGQRYTVKSGDTVWRIASRYKVSRENLLKINNISDPRKLSAGREIKIPVQ